MKPEIRDCQNCYEAITKPCPMKVLKHCVVYNEYTKRKAAREAKEE